MFREGLFCPAFVSCKSTAWGGGGLISFRASAKDRNSFFYNTLPNRGTHILSILGMSHFL